MTEPLIPTSTPIPQETLDYQPLSGWAIAGFAVGLCFAFLVVISAVVALFQGAPFFFPLWVMALAILGVVLSLIGQQHVQNSEGTRAGAKLARAGLWLSLLSGLSYFSYYYFTGLALQSQANDFLMEKGDDSGFFPLMREGGKNPTKLNAAFLLTVPATARSGRPEDDVQMREIHDASPKEGTPGKLTNFKEEMFGRVFFDGLADDAVITPLTVQDWRYEKRSYKIIRPYRIVTKEVELEVLMVVQSTEAEAAGESRKWFVNTQESGTIARRYTKVGESISLLRALAQKKLEAWLQALNDGQSDSAFATQDETPWDSVLFLYKKEPQAPLRAAVTQAFTGSGTNRLLSPAIVARPTDIGKWEQRDGKIRVYLNFRFGVPAAAGNTPTANVLAYAALDTRQVIDPAQFDSRSPAPEWDIARLGMLLVARPQERKGPP